MKKARNEIAIGIVIDQDKVLLAERESSESNGSGELLSWVFPGGKLENGESPEQAVTREIVEETGYQCIANHRITEGDHSSFPVYIYYIACELQRDIERAETSDVAIRHSQFVPKSEIKDYVTSTINPHVARFLGIE